MPSIFSEPRKLWAWLERLKGDRATVERRWQEIADHQLGRGEFTSRDHTPGRERQAEIYDTTAQIANQQLAAGLHGMLTNPAGDWLDLMPGDPRILEDDDAREWLSRARRTTLEVFQSGTSNFPTQIAEVYLDLPPFGTAALCETARDGRIRFCTYPMNEVFLEQNADREVDVVFRETQLTARQWATIFPDDDAPKIREALEKNAEKRFTIVQMVARSDDPLAGSSPFRKEWISVFFTREGHSSGEPRIVETRGFDENPIITPRWEVHTGETYGRGPGWSANPGAMQLNVMMKVINKYAEKAADPPLLVTHKSVLGDGKVRMYPGGITYVGELFGRGGNPEPIRHLDFRGRHDISVDLLTRIQTQVRNAYFGQQFQFFDDPNMSATQVLELAGQVQRQMAPLLGRVTSELLDRLITRTFNLALRLRLFPPVPAALRGQVVNGVYTSPIARAQRQSEAAAILQTWQAAAQIAEQSQDVSILQALDPDESVRAIHEASAAPIRILRGQAEVEERRQAMAQQAQERQALEQFGEGANIVETLSRAVREGQPAQAA